MFPADMHPLPIDLNQLVHEDQIIFSPKLQSSSSSSSLSPTPTPTPTPPFFSQVDQYSVSGGPSSSFYMDSQLQLQQQQQQGAYNKFVSHGESYDHHDPTIIVDHHQVQQQQHDIQSDNGLKFTIRRREDSNEYETAENNNNSNSNSAAAKWMSSKMRMMRKMINSDRTATVDPPTSTTTNSMMMHHKFDHELDHQKLPSSPLAETDNSSNSSCNNNNNNSIRVCADCNTTKTPLWRSGPRGPKTLCNACGIRQRKARRAMAAAAAAANGTILPCTTPPTKSSNNKMQHKNKRSSTSHNINNGQVPQFKKRSKINNINAPSPVNNIASGGRKKICFEDLRISLSKNSAFQQVFPQDEKEAAILLMALSYGLVHG